jgi:hypothetical protein
MNPFQRAVGVDDGPFRPLRDRLPHHLLASAQPCRRPESLTRRRLHHRPTSNSDPYSADRPKLTLKFEAAK